MHAPRMWQSQDVATLVSNPADHVSETERTSIQPKANYTKQYNRASEAATKTWTKLLVCNTQMSNLTTFYHVSKVIVGNKQSHCNMVKHKFLLKDLYGTCDESEILAHVQSSSCTKEKQSSCFYLASSSNQSFQKMHNDTAIRQLSMYHLLSWCFDWM
jgi:hypothetical protein